MVGFFYAHTDTEHKKDIGVDDLPDLDDAPLKFKYGKDLLLDWALRDCPSFMRRFHNWYKRACILGLKTIYAPHHSDVFGLKGQQIFDISHSILKTSNTCYPSNNLVWTWSNN